MKTQKQPKSLMLFSIILIVWILIANATIHLIGYEYGWVVFVSNIMLFLLPGDLKTRFLTVEVGGFVGLVLTVGMLLAANALGGIIGHLFGFLIPLAVVLVLLIIVHPYAPIVFNNVGFAYLICATIAIPNFVENLPSHFIGFVVGSLVFNGVCVLLLKYFEGRIAKEKAANAAAE